MRLACVVFREVVLHVAKTETARDVFQRERETDKSLPTWAIFSRSSTLGSRKIWSRSARQNVVRRKEEETMGCLPECSLLRPPRIIYEAMSGENCGRPPGVCSIADAHRPTVSPSPPLPRSKLERMKTALRRWPSRRNRFRIETPFDVIMSGALARYIRARRACIFRRNLRNKYVSEPGVEVSSPTSSSSTLLIRVPAINADRNAIKK